MTREVLRLEQVPACITSEHGGIMRLLGKSVSVRDFSLKQGASGSAGHIAYAPLRNQVDGK